MGAGRLTAERGPVPKRSDQRRRRNSDSAGITAAVSDGKVRGPKLIGRHSAVGKRFYEALRRSGQAQFFEPSDWAAAELVVLAIDSYVKKPTASMFLAVESAWSNLLVTEGDRRRARLELEQPKPEGGEANGDVSWLADARRRRESGESA